MLKNKKMKKLKNKKMKKLQVFAIMAMIMAMLLSACSTSSSTLGSTADGNNTADVSSDEKVELRFLLWGNQQEIDYKAKWTEEFNAENDRIHVTLEAIPEGFHEKLTAQVSSGTLADLVQIAGDFGAVYFEDGLIEPLDSYIERDGQQDVWIDGIMEGLSYNGSVYAAPMSFNAGYIIYNKTMFEENNVPLPTNDWTEEEFLAAAKALTEGEGDNKVWGIDFSSWWSYSLAINFYEGYRAWDWENNVMTANTQGFRDGVQFIDDLYKVHQVSPSPTMSADIGGTFENGKYAMTIGASWDMEGFNKAIGDSFEWDIVTFPHSEKYDQWRSPLWTTAIGMSADTPYKDECWEYISYMTAQEKVQSQMEIIGLPALQSISEDEGFISTIPEGWKPFNKQVYFDALNYAVDGVVLNEIKDEVMKYELDLLFTGEQDIDTTLENIQKKGQLKLDRIKQ